MTPGLATYGLSFLICKMGTMIGKLLSPSSSPVLGAWGKREVMGYYTVLHTYQMCECRRTPEKEKIMRMVLGLQNFSGKGCGGDLSWELEGDEIGMDSGEKRKYSR